MTDSVCQVMSGNFKYYAFFKRGSNGGIEIECFN